MNKTLIFSLIFFGTAIYPAIGFGQTIQNPEVRFGVKAGGNLALVNFDSTVRQTFNPGFIGGLSFQHINHKNIGIQLEVNYFQGGWKENIDTIYTYQRRLHYIQVPFMTHARFRQGRTSVLLNLGPYISVLFEDQKRANFGPECANDEYYWRDIDNPLEFGFCAGLGISINTGVGLFQLEDRANYSLSNIFAIAPETAFYVSNNMSAEVSMTYYIEACRIKSGARKLLFWR